MSASPTLGDSHATRLALISRGLARGYLALDEVEAELPPGSLSPVERWIFLYSLRALGIELKLEWGADASVPYSGGL